MAVADHEQHVDGPQVCRQAGTDSRQAWTAGRHEQQAGTGSRQASTASSSSARACSRQPAAAPRSPSRFTTSITLHSPASHVPSTVPPSRWMSSTACREGGQAQGVGPGSDAGQLVKGLALFGEAPCGRQWPAQLGCQARRAGACLRPPGSPSAGSRSSSSHGGWHSAHCRQPPLPRPAHHTTWRVSIMGLCVLE